MATALTLTDGLIQQTEGFAVESDISTALKNYLPLAGGELSGALTLPEILIGANAKDATFAIANQGILLTVLNAQTGEIVFSVDENANVSYIQSLGATNMTVNAGQLSFDATPNAAYFQQFANGFALQLVTGPSSQYTFSFGVDGTFTPGAPATLPAETPTWGQVQDWVTANFQPKA